MSVPLAQVGSLKGKVDRALLDVIAQLGPKSRLRDACEYALKTGGKRFRPLLVLLIAEQLEKGLEAMPAALAVELFHTASLIADDLPCMDNDALRRGLPSLHRAYNESTALLCTYALIAEGYEKVRENADLMGEKRGEVCSLALASATKTTGILGASLGQFYDLYPPSELDEAEVRKIIFYKTVALFELSFVFGWLFGGGDPSRLPEVKKTAKHFGMAFQIADDFADRKEDEANFRVNFVSVCGPARAKEVLQEERDSLFASTHALGLTLTPLTALFE